MLDWGGTGRPVVLLTGSGNTAHVFDDFAPKLADCCHVYAITRRGFGLSSHPESGYDDQRLADDVFEVLNALQIQSPVLVGHSMAGSELTTVATQHSDRLSGLIYLDAGSDPADFPWSDPAYRAAVEKIPPPAPDPRLKALEVNRKKSYVDFRAWQWATTGFAFCEAEVRNAYEINADGSIGAFRTPKRVPDAIDAGTKKRDYSKIGVPVLAFFAPPLPAANESYSILMTYVHRYENSLRSAVPGARILEFPGANHYVYLSNESDVLREIHAFVAALR